MGEHDRVAGSGPHPGDEAVGASGYLGDALATGTGAGPDRPTRNRGADRCGRDALVVAVVPFPKVVVDLGPVGQPREFACSSGPLHGAAQHGGNIQALQHRREVARLTFTVSGEGDIGTTRVLPTRTPFRRSVANEMEQRSMADVVHVSRSMGGSLGQPPWPRVMNLAEAGPHEPCA